jgi:hypothetical protein
MVLNTVPQLYCSKVRGCVLTILIVVFFEDTVLCMMEVILDYLTDDHIILYYII